MTLQSIANEAGVSKTTVHRVLTGKGEVSPETVKLVQQVMKNNGYLKSRAGQLKNNNNLSSEPLFKTGNIGFLVVERPVKLLKMPLLVKLLTEIEKALAEYELLMTVIQVPDPQKPYPMINSDRLDGLLIFGEPSSRVLRSKFRTMHSVGLLTSEHFDDSWFDWISSDFKSRGKLAVRYFEKKGHTKIAYLNPINNHPAFLETGYFFEYYAKKAGLDVTMLVSERELNCKLWDPEIGNPIIRELVLRYLTMPVDERPTGIHVANDEIAVSVYREFQKNGVFPGQDVEIIGCGNDDEFLRKMSPRPASMDLNIGEIARRAVDKLIYRIKNEYALSGITVLVPPKLVPAEE